MERTAVVSIVDGVQIEFEASVWEAEDGLIVLRHSNGATVAVLNQAHVKYIAFKDKKPQPPADYALGHKDVEKTGFSAGDRAVVTLPGDQWRNMTVDILGPLTFPPNTYATKVRGEVLVSVYHRDNLRPVPEERRNESR